ncbi:MAG: HEAT repeat domain-containing protein [Halobacteriales archaeon]
MFEPGFDDMFLYELAREGETSELVAYMKHAENPDLRERAAELLGDFADTPRAIDRAEIVRELTTVVTEEENDEVRARAIDSLHRHGPESVDKLITAMADFDAEDTPDWMKSKELVEWLDSEYAEFRMVAATALGRIGNEHAVPYLVDAFDDLDPRVRKRAVRSCGRIGDERAIDPLADRLEDSEPLVQRAAAEALGAIGTPDALERLIPAARVDDERVRHIAVSELSELRSTKPLVVLVRALEDESASVRRAATLSLIELIAADTGADENIRRVVTGQLATVDAAELVPQLLDVFSESTRRRIRRTVVWLLGRVVDPEVEEAKQVHEVLLDALDEEGLAESAEESLVHLDGEALEKRLRIFVQQEEGSEEAIERADRILDRIGSDRVGEVVQNSVDYTYVQEPADYTRKKQNERE